MDDFTTKPEPESTPSPEGVKTGNLTRQEELNIKTSPVMSPIGAAFIGLFGGLFLYQVVGGLITVIIFGVDVENIPVNSIRLMTIAGQLLFILLPALLFSKWIYQDTGLIVRAKLPELTELLLFILGVVILVPLLQSYLYIQMFLIELLADNWSLFRSVKDLLDSYNKIVEDAYNTVIITHTLPESFLVVFVVAVVPAFSEEFMFRGFVQSSFEYRLKPAYAALITAVFFGIFHFNPYGIIPLIALGFYFGYAAYMSNSIFVPVTLHFLNNFTAVVLFFIIGDEELLKSAPTEEVDIPSALSVFVLLSLLFAGAVFLIKNYYSKRSQTIKAGSGNFKEYI